LLLCQRRPLPDGLLLLRSIGRPELDEHSHGERGGQRESDESN
jgi:hypothetical protein